MTSDSLPYVEDPAEGVNRVDARVGRLESGSYGTFNRLEQRTRALEGRVAELEDRAHAFLRVVVAQMVAYVVLVLFVVGSS